MNQSEDKTPELLVSDYAITQQAESYADLEMTKNDGESYSTHLGGYEFDAKQTRSFYEADRSTHLARISELEAQVARLREAGDVAIDQLRQFSEKYGSNHDKAYFYNILAAWDAAFLSPTPTPPTPTT